MTKELIGSAIIVFNVAAIAATCCYIACGGWWIYLAYRGKGEG